MALEVVRAAPTARHGDAFVSADVTKGSFVVLSGTFSQSDIDSLPAGQKETPGYAYAGDPKLVQAWAGNVADTGPAYPVDKKIFVPEDADLDSSFETIKAGSQALYYDSGEFRTTEYTDLTTTVVYGDFLKLSASGTLTDEANLKVATNATVARVIELADDHASPGDRRLHFRMFKAGV